MNIKGIIFDFGFTLFYFKDVSLEKYLDCYKHGLQLSIQHLRESNIEIDDKTAKKLTKYFLEKRNFFFRESLKTKNEYPTVFIFKNVLDLMIENDLINSNDDINDKNLMKLADIYHSCEEDEWIPYEHTKSTLDQLLQKDIKMVVLSNHPHHSTIKNLLKKYELDEYFDKIITSAKFGKRKPNPDIFKYALQKIGLEDNASQCIICGDEYADIIGGHQVGLQLFLCKREYKFPFERDIEISNYITIKDISELLAYV
ncbi:MAG: HAD family hydrolase [Promethearchaeota archaeon]